MTVDVVTDRHWEITSKNECVKIGKTEKFGSYIYRITIEVAKHKEFTDRKGKISAYYTKLRG